MEAVEQVVGWSGQRGRHVLLYLWSVDRPTLGGSCATPSSGCLYDEDLHSPDVPGSPWPTPQVQLLSDLETA